ncbi:hypothetical protein ACOSQ4_003181 [Xanthoceras sorbifolium]
MALVPRPSYLHLSSSSCFVTLHRLRVGLKGNPRKYLNMHEQLRKRRREVRLELGDNDSRLPIVAFKIECGVEIWNPLEEAIMIVVL